MLFWEKQKILIALYEKITKPVCDKYGLTQMEYDILMFLHNNPQFKTASDIVKIRQLTKSHVSASIKILESKGYLFKHYADDNKKSLILVITDAAKDIVVDGEKAQLSFGQTIFNGFSANETATCKDLFFRMCENANKVLSNKRQY